MSILKIPREAVVPRKVLMKINPTLDCSMIKATIGNVNFAACSTIIDRTANNQDLTRSKPNSKE